jgi:hypothetical protein
MLEGASVNVKDYGAVGDGVTDDTAAIQAAINAVKVLTQSGTGGIWGTPTQYSGSSPELFFSKGVYKITSALTADNAEEVNYFSIRGEKAVLVLDSGVTAFGGIGYMVDFRGITFRGGACAISIKTNNVDKCMITIDNCEFLEQTDSCIRSDSTSNSTALGITNTKLVQIVGGGYIFKFPTIDLITVARCWIKCNTQVGMLIGEVGAPSSSCKMVISHSVGVPGGDMALPGGRWADVYGELHTDFFRFGGEAGGSASVRFLGDNVGGISITNSSVYASEYFIEFYGLPSFLYLDGINGLDGSDGLYFDTSITNEQFRVFQEDADISVIGIIPNAQGGYAILGSPDYNPQTKLGLLIILTKLISKQGWNYIGTTERLDENLVLSSAERDPSGWGTSGTDYIATVTSGIYNINQKNFLATADGGAFVYRNDNYLDPTALTPEKAYTFIVMVDSIPATDNVLRLEIVIGGMKRFVSLTGGRQTIAIPFVYLNDTGAAITAMDRLAYDCRYMPDTAQISVGRIMLLEGIHNYTSDICTMVTAGTTPTSISSVTNQTDSFLRGDIAYSSSPTAGGTIGEICVLEGNVGTWKSFGAITA